MESSGVDRAVPAGRRLGHYEILGEIGRGGMGVVYRARDLNLQREVALKCPLAEASPDKQVRERLLHEARAAARLISPHIVPIFEVFEEEGRPWLAMELVDGRGLDDIIDRDGPLGPRQVARLGGQVAEALAVAHEHGILHRDVKPSNILIARQGGGARLMDFGLAKPFFGEDEGSASGEMTVTAPLTATGKVAGTVAYMSPEQILGRPLDPRTDLFSLGAVLYEASTGRAPFAPSREGSVIDAVLHHEPVPVTEAAEGQPPELARIIRKALAKKPADRHPTARRMAEELHALARRLEFETYQSELTVLGRWLVSPSDRRRRVVALGAAALLAGLAAWWAVARSGEPVPAFDEALMEPLVTWPSDEREGRISPDGRWVSFQSDRGGEDRLWIRDLADGEPQPVWGPDGELLSHAWSPAGTEIALLVQRRGQWWVELLPAPLGGRSRIAYRAVENLLRVVAWRRSGLMLESNAGLWRMDPASGELERLALADDDLLYPGDYDVSADGRWVAFSATRDRRENVWLGDLQEGRSRPLTDDAFRSTDPRWLGTAARRLIYRSNETGQFGLWQLDRDGDRRRVPTAREVKNVNAVSSDGRTLLLRVEEETADLWIADPERGAMAPVSADSLHDFHPSYAAANGLVAFQRSKPGRGIGTSFLEAQLFAARLEGDGLVDEHRVVAEGYAPLLSPDGRWLTYLKTDASAGTELRLLEVGTGQESVAGRPFQFAGFLLSPPELAGRDPVWLPDSEALLYVGRGADRRPQIWRLAAQERSESLLLDPGLAWPSEIRDLRVSPDGRWLLFLILQYERDLFELRVLDLESGEERPVLAVSGAEGGALFSLGWSTPSSIVALRGRANDDHSHDLEVLELDLGGALLAKGTLSRAFALSARLDPARRWLYATRSERGVHNLYRLALAGGEPAPVTDNRLGGVTFSGVEVLPGGRLLFSRQEVNPDLWLLHSP